MKKHYLAGILFLLLGGILLAGCSSKSEKPAEEEEDKRIVYWTMWTKNSAQGKLIQEAAETFTSEKGIELKVQYKGTDDLRDGLLPALEKGTQIDLFDYDMDYLNEKWSEELLSLEAFSEAWRYEETAREVLMEAAREAGGGELKSIPYQMEIYAFYYNRLAFREAGVSNIPQTWDEFMAACEKLKAAGITPVTGDEEYYLCMLGHQLARIAGEEEAERIIREGIWDHPSLQQAVGDFQEMAEKEYFSAYIAENELPVGQVAEFAGGEAAIYFGTSGLPAAVDNIIGEEFRWGCFAYPTMEKEDIRSGAVQFKAKAFGIHKDTDHAKEIFDFIEMLTKGSYDERIAEDTLGIPSDTNNRTWPEQLRTTKIVVNKIESRMKASEIMESNSSVTDELLDNIKKVFDGTMTKEGFASAMQAVTE